MHILDSYALSCGAKIDKPYIYSQYYPLGESKYITIQPFSNYDGKQYDYWNEVIEYVHPYLDKNEIKIVQIGQKGDKPLIKSIWTQGTTKLSQAAFLIKNSLLHVGVDSFGAHIASGYGKKVIGLYSTNWAENCKPYWSKPEDCTIMEPDRTEKKPSFAYSDGKEKTINENKAEDIANAILKSLNINERVSYETVHIGEFFTKFSIHTVPSSVAQLEDRIEHVIIRMDLDFNESVLIKQIEMSKACSIMTDKPINVDIIKAFKNKIQDIVYFIKEDHNINFVKEIHQTGINYILITKIQGEELNKIKFDYLDYNFIFTKEDNEKIKSKILEIPLNNLVFKSNKKYLKDGKVYNSVASLKAEVEDENIASCDFVPLIDSPEFWEDLDDFYIAKKA